MLCTSPDSFTLQKEKVQTAPPNSIQLLGFSGGKRDFPSLYANSRMQQNQMDYDGAWVTGQCGNRKDMRSLVK